MTFERIAEYQTAQKVLKMMRYSYAFPSIARGHGSRRGKHFCVQPGCKGHDSTAHNQSPSSAAAQWIKENE